ncbi:MULTISPECIES: FMN-binding protein [unclassified Carboxylicivirga]|uniref:FMN-binding protein n=1 Tax=Carboxylicivirga TaxID=1628153 RepID=UPI003D326C6C
MKKIINGLAYFSLLIAFIIGLWADKTKNELNGLAYLSTHKLSLGEAHDGVYPLLKKGELAGYLALGEAQGYGGPLQIVVITDTTALVKETIVYQAFETPSFLAKLHSNKFFQQFTDKPASASFVFGEDIQGVTGATISSRAINEATRKAAHIIASEQFKIEVAPVVKQWSLSYLDGIIALILITGIFLSYKRIRKIRTINLGLGIVFIGFVLNASLSLTHFGRLFLGYFPDIHTHLSWWLLLLGTISILVINGKNIYCNSICPFGATQMLLHQISGINLKLKPQVMKRLSQTPYILLWLALMLTFLSRNPSIASYEPFAMLFSLDGVGIQWYILPAALLGALFVSNFFCRFFCPVGGMFRWINKTRTFFIGLIPGK